MVWWVLFQKAFSDLSSKADLLNTTEGSHGVFISLILPLKWSTICDDEKCPVLSDQPSLTTKMFSCVFSLRSDWSPWSVVVLPPALLSRKCFCGPGMLWVLSAGLTPHTAPSSGICLHRGRWAGQHSLNSQTQEELGVSAWKPPLHMAQPSLSGSLVPFWSGNLPEWWRGHAAALKGASSGLCHSRQHVGGGIPYCH